jgi:hypothetical protein
MIANSRFIMLVIYAFVCFVELACKVYKVSYQLTPSTRVIKLDPVPRLGGLTWVDPG